ncbi:MAG: DUF6350 family protein [Actinomycetota bacterium]
MWRTGIRSGAIIFLVAALIGQAIAWFDFLLIPGASGGLDVPNVAKIGVLYLASFNRIPVSAEISAVGMSQTVSFSLAFGLITLGLVFLLYRAGKKLANDAGGDALRRMVIGMMVAPSYAALTLLVALVMTLRPLVAEGGELTVAPALFGSLLMPLVLAAVAGGAGGLLSDRDALFRRWSVGRRVAGALAGGWRMLVFGMVFAVVGMLVLIVIHPDDSKVYFAGYRAIGEDGGAVAVLHNTLLLPNEAVMVLAPSMGACDGIYGGMVQVDLVCYSAFPSDAPPTAPSTTSDPITALAGSLPTPQAAPAVYLMFLVVPLLATILGGRAAARLSRASGRGQGAINGALAGVVFAILVGVAAWFAGVDIGSGGGSGGGGILTGGSMFVGAGIAGTAMFGLAWGVGGGALGGALGAAPAEGPGSPDLRGDEEDDEPDEVDLGGGGRAPEEDPGLPIVPPDPA